MVRPEEIPLSFVRLEHPPNMSNIKVIASKYDAFFYNVYSKQLLERVYRKWAILGSKIASVKTL